MLRSKSSKALFASVLLITAFSAAPSGAQAQWTSNGPLTGVTMNFGPVRWTINTTPPVTIDCTGASASGGKVAGPTGPGSGNWDVLTNLTFSFTGCTIMGLAANVTCTGTSTFTAASYASPVVNGFLKGFTCQVKPISFPSCTINLVASGAGGKVMNATYNNTTAVMTFSLTGQTWTASWVSCPMISPSSGSSSATFSKPSGAVATGTVTSSPKPVVTG